MKRPNLYIAIAIVLGVIGVATGTDSNTSLFELGLLAVVAAIVYFVRWSSRVVAVAGAHLVLSLIVFLAGVHRHDPAWLVSLLRGAFIVLGAPLFLLSALPNSFWGLGSVSAFTVFVLPALYCSFTWAFLICNLAPFLYKRLTRHWSEPTRRFTS